MDQVLSLRVEQHEENCELGVSCMAKVKLAVSNPGSVEDVVELLVPELQRRGLYWEDYPVPGGTLRENAHNVPGKPFLSPDHPGSKIVLNGSQSSDVKFKEALSVSILGSDVERY